MSRKRFLSNFGWNDSKLDMAARKANEELFVELHDTIVRHRFDKSIMSTRKTYAPVAYGSKRFFPSQTRLSIYAKVFRAIHLAFKKFGHIVWGTPKPVIILQTANQ